MQCGNGTVWVQGVVSGEGGGQCSYVIASYVGAGYVNELGKRVEPIRERVVCLTDLDLSVCGDTTFAFRLEWSTF